MTDKKISELPQITGSAVDDANDELPIVDASTNTTKAITRAELFSGLDSLSVTYDSVTTNEATLAAIAETKAETAVDVFVYDTSKDSDGGAWRKRTQHTSWYNETLNTSTRGSRREFPAVAVIVAESSKVTIYDGDDPALPMWMVFNTGGTASWATMKIVSHACSSLGMLNGVMSVGSASIDGAMTRIQFVNDFAYRHHPSTSFGGPHNGSISERNDLVGFTVFSGVNPANIVNGSVNDVAMTVLPDAPVDPATGLPVPTILVGTNGNGTYSASIITDSGDVWDIAPDGTEEAVSVHFDGVSAVVTRSDGTVYVWGDARAISADGTSPDATYSPSSTPALLGSVSEVAA